MRAARRRRRRRRRRKWRKRRRAAGPISAVAEPGVLTRRPRKMKQTNRP